MKKVFFRIFNSVTAVEMRNRIPQNRFLRMEDMRNRDGIGEKAPLPSVGLGKPIGGGRKDDPNH